MSNGTQVACASGERVKTSHNDERHEECIGCKTGNFDMHRRPVSIQRASSFVEAMAHLKKCQWYWGGVSWRQAERALRPLPAGAFLLRDSASDRYIFTVSVAMGGGRVKHARVPQHAGIFSFGGPNSPLRAASAVDFIVSAMRRSSAGQLHFLMHDKDSPAEAQPIVLRQAVSRNVLHPSLKHLCRLTLLQSVPWNMVDALPLPNALRAYLKDPHVADVTKL